MMSRGQPLVSIVSPVHNEGEHLRECADSVLAQTYQNWEWVIVNNGSTDDTLEIAREYAARDSRIRVHDNETTVRMIPNHNIALRLTSRDSTYCKVLGGDDWLFPEYLEKIVAHAEDHPSVAVVQCYRLQGTDVAGDGLPYPSTVIPGREACRLWLLPGGPSIFGPTSALLFRSDIVRSRDPFFNELNIHADIEACLETLEFHDFGFVHQVLVYYRLRDASMTSYSSDNQTYLAGRLADLVAYGPRYLDEQELRRTISGHLHLYYRALGSQVFKRPRREYWRLHRAKLASLGYAMQWRRVAAYAVLYLLGIVLDPARTANRVAQWRRRTASGTDGPASA